MVVEIKKSKARLIIDLVITLLGWTFLFLFFFNVIKYFHMSLSVSFYALTLDNTNAIILFTILLFLMVTLMLGWWSSFNKRKYGSLTRRKFPTPTNHAEVAGYFDIKIEEIDILQKERYIEIE